MLEALSGQFHGSRKGRARLVEEHGSSSQKFEQGNGRIKNFIFGRQLIERHHGEQSLHVARNGTHRRRPTLTGLKLIIIPTNGVTFVCEATMVGMVYAY